MTVRFQWPSWNDRAQRQNLKPPSSSSDEVSVRFNYAQLYGKGRYLHNIKELLRVLLITISIVFVTFLGLWLFVVQQEQGMIYCNTEIEMENFSTEAVSYLKVGKPATVILNNNTIFNKTNESKHHRTKRDIGVNWEESNKNNGILCSIEVSNLTDQIKKINAELKNFRTALDNLNFDMKNGGVYSRYLESSEFQKNQYDSTMRYVENTPISNLDTGKLLVNELERGEKYTTNNFRMLESATDKRISMETVIPEYLVDHYHTLLSLNNEKPRAHSKIKTIPNENIKITRNDDIQDTIARRNSYSNDRSMSSFSSDLQEAERKENNRRTLKVSTSKNHLEDGNSGWKIVCFIAQKQGVQDLSIYKEKYTKAENFSAYSLNEHKTFDKPFPGVTGNSSAALLDIYIAPFIISSNTASGSPTVLHANLLENQSISQYSSNNDPFVAYTITNLPLYCTYLPTYIFPNLLQISASNKLVDNIKMKTEDEQNQLLKTNPSSQVQPREFQFPADFDICDQDENLCADKKACISSAHWCDGIVNCLDASDEVSCSCKERVDRGKLCDGYFDCPDGEDERGCFGCPEDSFSCDDWTRWRPNSTCVSMNQRCDGHLDCLLNGKDEKDCLLLASHIVHQQTFLISYSSGFLHRNWRGHWYPACVSKLSQWPTLACQAEMGPFITQAKITLTPVRSNLYKDKFVWEVPEKSPELIPYCHEKDHAIYVSCPELFCGSRYPSILDGQLDLQMQEENRYRLKRTDKNSTSSLGAHVNHSGPVLNRETSLIREIIKLALGDMRNGNKYKNNSIAETNYPGVFNKIRKVREEERVVGGQASKAGQWPWLIALYKNGIFHCGGVILDIWWIMTAAHCVHQYEENYFEVQAGILRRLSFSPMEQTRMVSHVIVHEGYSRSDMSNDIALLRMEQPLRLNRWVRPICLPEGRPPWGPVPGTICTAVGWGATLEHGPDPDNMREVEVPILTQCKHVSDRQGDEICAGFIGGGHDTCQGDSGGPLLCRVPTDPDRWYVAGIVSHGEGCARPMEPGAYTRVALYLPWIIQHTDEVNLPANKRPVLQCPGIKCHDGGRCVSIRRVCDRVVDCLNAQDELKCENNSFNKDDPALLQIVEEAFNTGSLSFKSSMKPNENHNSTIVKMQTYYPLGNISKINTTRQISKSTLVYTNGSIQNHTTHVHSESMSPTSSILKSYTNFADEMTNKSAIFICERLFQVVPISCRCDGTVHCEDGSDERTCSCSDYLYTASPSAICDGHIDCFDFSDEAQCVTSKNCSINEFYCPKSNTCIEELWRCDGIQDCQQAEDEDNCYAFTNGYEVITDNFGFPVVGWQGIITYNNRSVWKPLCISNNVTIDTALEICAYLGYSGYKSFEKILVWDHNLPLSSMRWIDAVQKHCVGVDIKCFQTHRLDDMKQPWHTDIYINGNRRCPAVLLTSEWIIASYSCYYYLRNEQDYSIVSLGSSRFSELVQSPNEQIIEINGVYDLPNNSGMIAHLAHPCNATEYVKPLTLPQWIPSQSENDHCVTVGYNAANEITSVRLYAEPNNCSEGYKCYSVRNKSALCMNDKWPTNAAGVACLSKNSWYLSSLFDDEMEKFCSHDTDILHLSSFANILTYVSHITQKNFTSPKLIPDCKFGIRCPLGNCVNWPLICDGKPHCRRNKDELPEVCLAKQDACVSNSDFCRCKEEEMSCLNGQCVHKSSICNGVRDCTDNTDELYCNNFTCATFLNLTAPYKLCDSKVDCMDKTDENIQICDHSQRNSTLMFNCNSSNMRIPIEFVCDGERDCLHGEDEATCLALHSFQSKKNEGILMVRSRGEWFPECLSADFTSSDMGTICLYLGFQHLLHVQYLPATKTPSDMFTTIKLASKISISLRLRKQMMAPTETCFNIFLSSVKRLMREAAELKEPTEDYSANPVNDNLFEWHFTIKGCVDSDFKDGIYHGQIMFPCDYPMKPPNILLFTPNGRFELNKKICLSISGYHPETWQPSWSVRTALLALIAFMPTPSGGTIGSLDYTSDERQALARKSQMWECAVCGKIKYLLTRNDTDYNNGKKPVTEDACKQLARSSQEYTDKLIEHDDVINEEASIQREFQEQICTGYSSPSLETVCHLQSPSSFPYTAIAAVIVLAIGFLIYRRIYLL